MNYDEFAKRLISDDAGDFLLSHPREIAAFVPEMRPCMGFKQNNPYHVYDVYEHTVRAIMHAPVDFTVRMALFFHDIGKPECYTEDERGGHFIGHGRAGADIAGRGLERWGVGGSLKREIKQLVFYHDASFSAARKHVRRWLGRLGEVQYRRLLELKRADMLAHNPVYVREELDKVERIKQVLEEVLADTGRMTVKDLAISGSDLLALGYGPGRAIGEALNIMLKKVGAGELPNEKQELLNFAVTYRRERLQ